MTKKEVLSVLVNEEVIKGNADYLAYVKNELALLDKRAENRKQHLDLLAGMIICSTVSHFC